MLLFKPTYVGTIVKCDSECPPIIDVDGVEQITCTEKEAKKINTSEGNKTVA